MVVLLPEGPCSNRIKGIESCEGEGVSQGKGKCKGEGKEGDDKGKKTKEANK
jgi:hypothetical protein